MTFGAEDGQRLFTLEFSKEDMKFSAGHFTVFSATERERLHGHNFAVQVRVTGCSGPSGMAVDHGVYKRRIRSLCEAWDEVFILPGRSPVLRCEEEGEYVYACLANERVPFLRSDVLILPIENATIESLARLFLDELMGDGEFTEASEIVEVEVKVFSSPGQCGVARWSSHLTTVEPRPLSGSLVRD